MTKPEFTKNGVNIKVTKPEFTKNGVNIKVAKPEFTKNGVNMINKKTVLCLSGWAQKPNSLENLFTAKSNHFEVINFDYSIFNNIDDFFQAILDLRIKPDIIVGWSLGGQLACRLIAEKILSSNHLVLISTPFQFVKSRRIAAAMPQKSFDEFYHNFVSRPDKTLKKFSLLMNINDKNATQLADNLDINDNNHQKLAFWLKELERFSCYDLKFDDFPKTNIIHGSSDLVVHPSQSKIFKEKISNSELKIINGCGHTPHMSDNSLVF